MIDDIAAHLNTLESVVNTETQGNKIIIKVTINNEEFILLTDFGSNFPIELPDIYLKDPSKYGYLPHVCWQGKVCYNDGEGVSSDLEQPSAIAEYAVNKAIGTLSIEKNIREEIFFDEFEGYWSQQNLVQACYSFFEPDNELQLLKVPVTKRDKTPVAFFSDNSEVSPSTDYSFLGKCKNNRTQMYGVYLPLERRVNPPLPGARININFLDEILRELSTENTILWEKFLSKRKLPKEALHLIISQPRPKKGKSLFGVTIPFGLNWLNGRINEYDRIIKPLKIIRHTPKHLLERSGGQLNIADKKIAIIGCGSIGGRIAELLIMSGIKNLTLIDNDNFSSENLYRHVLDSTYIGSKKVVSLEKQLKSRFPYISINSLVDKVTHLTDSLAIHDVIVDVAGNPTLSRKLNISHRDMNIEKPTLLITSWVEPVGLGGHTVISDGRTEGCLHCLFHRDNSEQLSSIYNFVKENQTVSRNLTGCGGAFTPFSALDSTKTAEMATRMIINALASDVAGYSDLLNYQYWRGDNKDANEANINTTHWYSDCEYNVSDKVNAVFSEGCPMCRKK